MQRAGARVSRGRGLDRGGDRDGGVRGGAGRLP